MSIVNRKNRVFYMDFIRTFSLFCIILFHFQLEALMRTQNFSLSPFIGTPIGGINSGHLGSSLFLILSGASQAVSDRSLRGWIERGEAWTDSFSLKRYYLKRFIALFTAFYLVWIFAAVGSAVFMPEKLSGIAPWTLILTLAGVDGYFYEVVPNFYMTGEWFIGCVIFLYLLYPLLRQGLVRCPIKMAVMTVVLWIAMLILTVLIPGKIPSDHLFYLRLPEFVTGMYLAVYLKKVSLPLGVGSALLAICLMLLGVMNPPFNVVSYAVFGCCVYVFLRLLGEQWHRVDHPISNQIQHIVTFLARVSYPIFLLHHIVLMLMMEKGFGNIHLSGMLTAAVFAGWLAVLVFSGAILAVVSDKIGQKLMLYVGRRQMISKQNKKEI